jgi:pectinesterase
MLKILCSILFFKFAFTAVLQAQTGNAQQYKYTFTVAKDGTGDYKYIQDAIDAMRVYPLAPITLYIKNGVYNEKIELPSNNVDVSFVGENVDSTIIIFNDFSGKGKHTTFTSYTAKISGNRFFASNITFANNAGKVGQALALYVDADKAVFKNCKFLGNQDTIYASGETSNQLFEDCYIEGTTDFIFGSATAVFKNCIIKCKANSFITAASTSKEKKYGFVFMQCTVIADTGVTKVYLGRPWRAYAQTVFIQCNLPTQIAPAGWDNWGNIANESTAFYAEHNNTGDGANTAKRVAWSKQLSNKQAKKYTLQKIFVNNENWYDTNKLLPFNYNAFAPKTITEMPLYNGNVPNNKNVANAETSITKDNVTRISKVSIPTITVFKPQKPNGKSIIICPGGGYTILAFDKEGTRVADELTRWGVTVFVLKSRLPSDSININKSLAPLQDAQQAIQHVRNNAVKLGINKNQIGIMGFSAGGHLAATAATHFNFKANNTTTDTTSTRLDFAILIYPVISMDSSITHKGSRNNLLGINPTQTDVDFYSNELQVTKSTPPSFLVHASDDAAVPVQNSLRYYEACVVNKVPAELHVYPKGGHGFGMYNKTTDDNWMERLKNWLQRL